MADGSTVPSRRFVIRSLKVGDKVLENVTGSIAPVAGSLLLGQSLRDHQLALNHASGDFGETVISMVSQLRSIPRH